MSVPKPHSSYLDAVEDVRVYLTWVPPDHAKGAADALRRLEEQLEATQKELVILKGEAMKRARVEEQFESALALIKDAPDMDSLHLRDACRAFVYSYPASEPEQEAK